MINPLQASFIAPYATDREAKTQAHLVESAPGPQLVLLQGEVPETTAVDTDPNSEGGSGGGYEPLPRDGPKADAEPGHQGTTEAEALADATGASRSPAHAPRIDVVSKYHSLELERVCARTRHESVRREGLEAYAESVRQQSRTIPTSEILLKKAA